LARRIDHAVLAKEQRIAEIVADIQRVLAEAGQ
jgi:hypothetical protein